MSADDWSKCPAGELEKLAHQLKSQRRNRTLVKAAAPVLAVLLLIFSAPLIYNGVVDRDPDAPAAPIAIGCNEVLEKMNSYAKKELSEPVMTSIQLHLQECEHCKDRYRKNGVTLHSQGQLVLAAI